jgi:hypothetical protein
MTRDDIITDLELLKLAAKAAGIERDEDGEFCIQPHQDDCRWWDDDFCTCGAIWNPLDDDGDALRLAVRCGITVTPFKKDIVSDVEFQFFSRYAWWFGGKKVDCHDADQYAATRRAIVRAAAEIGRNMK